MLGHECGGEKPRDNFLSVECCDNPELRQEVESLIEESTAKTSFHRVTYHLIEKNMSGSLPTDQSAGYGRDG